MHLNRKFEFMSVFIVFIDHNLLNRIVCVCVLFFSPSEMLVHTLVAFLPQITTSVNTILMGKSKP